MVEYVTSETACRSRMLLRYFGEKNLHNCGQCDVCINHRTSDEVSTVTFEALKEKLLHLLKATPLTPARVEELIETDKEVLTQVIQYLLEEGEIEMKDGMLWAK